MTRRRRFRLFERHGIELEYMIVDRETCAVAPLADELLHAVTGRWTGDVSAGGIGWSNELALHVMELKTDGPVERLEGLGERFRRDVTRINGLLARWNAMLMPGGMHPFMDPAAETRLWPHAAAKVYRAYDRIFGCRSHGWANLQSMHVNLPFDGDGEFGRLHAALRLLLPVMPALAASSPLMDGRRTGSCDTRLAVYRANQSLVPSIVGGVIPESCFTRAEYEKTILAPIYRDMRRHDPAGTLRHEWLNSRGVIARFRRSALEIRLLDMQEHPTADAAVAALVTAAARALVENRWSPGEEQRSFDGARLRAILDDCIVAGDRAVIADRDYLAHFGLRKRLRAGDIWAHLTGSLGGEGTDLTALDASLAVIREHGCLARRMTAFLGKDRSRGAIIALCQKMAHCLAAGESLG